MGTDLGILAIYGLVVLALLPVRLAAARGRAWTPVGADGSGRALLSRRLDAALADSVAALAVFAPAVLIHAARDSFDGWTLLAGQGFLILRLVHLAASLAGMSWLRLPAWGAALLMPAFLYYYTLNLG